MAVISRALQSLRSNSWRQSDCNSPIATRDALTMGKNELKLASNIVRHRAEIKLQAPHAIDATLSR